MNVPLDTRVRMLPEACRLLVNEGLSAFLEPQTEHPSDSVIEICHRLERRIGRMCAIRGQHGEELR